MSNKVESTATFRVPPRVLYNSFLDEQDLNRLSLGSKCIMVSFIIKNNIVGSTNINSYYSF